MKYSTIWEAFADRFYTEPFLALCELTAIIIGVKYKSKERTGKLLILFIAFDLTVLILDWLYFFNISLFNINEKRFIRITNTLVVIFEINVYYYYFREVLKSQKLNKLFTSIPLFYTLIALLQNIFLNQIFANKRSYVSQLLFAIELLLILIPVIIYFYKLINTNSDTPLFSRPSFWISVGIFFQSIISIPCYLLLSFLLNQKTTYQPFIEATLYYTPLIINILFIIKAFLCKNPLTK